MFVALFFFHRLCHDNMPHNVPLLVVQYKLSCLIDHSFLIIHMFIYFTPLKTKKPTDIQTLGLRGLPNLLMTTPQTSTKQAL